MEEEYTISYLDQPVWKVIGGGLRDYNIQHAGEGHEKSMCFALQAEDGTVMGGIIGETHWNWLFITLLWIDEALRGQGYGHQLLQAAEREGRIRGATNAYLDTFSFQAPEFYQKHGYQVFGELEDFPPGYKRYYFTKQL